jgi:hypothetical protein
VVLALLCWRHLVLPPLATANLQHPGTGLWHPFRTFLAVNTTIPNGVAFFQTAAHSSVVERTHHNETFESPSIRLVDDDFGQLQLP